MDYIFGVKVEPKAKRIGQNVELGKPNEFRKVGFLQRKYNIQWVKESGESECRPVIGLIGVLDLLQSERMQTSCRWSKR